MKKNLSTVAKHLVTVDLQTTLQKECFEQLNKTDFLFYEKEAYKFTSFDAVLNEDIPFIERNYIKFQEYFYKTRGNHLAIVDGKYRSEISRVYEGKNSMEIITLESTKVYDRDPFNLLNSIANPNEVLIDCKDSCSPLFLYYFNTNGRANPKVTVSVPKNGEISITEKFITASNQFNNATINFDIATNGKVNHVKIQDYKNSGTYQHEKTYAFLSKDAQFTTNTFSFSGTLVRNNVHVFLGGENASANLNGLFYLNDSSHVDNYTIVDHLKPHTYSNELYKGIIDDYAKGIFNGIIYVKPNAQKIRAYQTNNNIILSEHGTLHTKPQLEIWADDVKCSHGCTSGQLDEENLFYLQTRGIPQNKAKSILLESFVKETFGNLSVDEILNQMDDLLQKRFDLL